MQRLKSAELQSVPSLFASRWRKHHVSSDGARAGCACVRALSLVYYDVKWCQLQHCRPAERRQSGRGMSNLSLKYHTHPTMFFFILCYSLNPDLRIIWFPHHRIIFHISLVRHGPFQIHLYFYVLSLHSSSPLAHPHEVITTQRNAALKFSVLINHNPY
jgi:hypothetical protein